MSTILHEKGYNSAWIETQLVHIYKNAIHSTYNHAQHMDEEKYAVVCGLHGKIGGELGNVDFKL